MIIRKTISPVFFVVIALLNPLSAQSESQVWHGIYLKGTKVGYSFNEFSKTKTGFKVLERITIDLNMLGAPKRLTTITEGDLDKDLNLKKFKFQMYTNDQSVEFQGIVKDNRIQITGSSISQREFAFKKKVVLTSMIPLLLKYKKLPKSFEVFDPSTFSLSDATSKYLGQEEITVHNRRYKTSVVRLSYMGTTSTLYYIDGRVVKEESPMQMETLLEPQEVATKLGGKKVDILRMFSVEPKGLKGNLTEYKKLVLELKGIPNADELSLDLEFASQKLLKKSKDKIVLEIDLPHLPEPKNGENNLDSSFDKYLGSTPSMQVDDPRVQELANKLTQGLTNPVEKAKRLLEYVYNSLEKRPTVTLPTASEVLDLGYGDCNEHAVLYGALARAAGIPTVITVGLVYFNNAYYYHAWNASYLNGKWVFVDPVMGEFPASIGHIMLKIGEIEEQSRLLPLVGNLEITVLNAN